MSLGRRSSIDSTAMRLLLAKALEDGAQRVSLSEFLWNCSGSCTEPVTRVIDGRFTPVDQVWETVPKWVDGTTYPRITLIMEVRCRKCAKCLSARARQWQLRMVRETSQASRTWFVTHTLRPDAHAWFGAMAAKANKEFHSWSLEKQFVARHKEISKEITKYLKRVRKTAGPLRFCAVAEAHKEKQHGLPHYHFLIHEMDPAQPVLKKHIKGDDSTPNPWQMGFSDAKLVEDAIEKSWYVSKYLSKSNLARVRASIRYGDVIPKITL